MTRVYFLTKQIQDTNSDTQRYAAKKRLSEYPEYLRRDSYVVLLPSLLPRVPLTHLLIFHLSRLLSFKVLVYRTLLSDTFLDFLLHNTYDYVSKMSHHHQRRELFHLLFKCFLGRFFCFVGDKIIETRREKNIVSLLHQSPKSKKKKKKKLSATKSKKESRVVPFFLSLSLLP